MGKRLTREFFLQPTLSVAKNLLGKVLVRIYKGKRLIGKIVETEAYIGPKDKASHAYLGKKTKRNRAEFLIGGHIYIYLVYGMYWQLNISTEKEGVPTCVLIRALEPIEGIKEMGKLRQSTFKESLRATSEVARQRPRLLRGVKTLKNLTNGPGKLCQALCLDKSFYAEDLCKSKRIWMEDGENVSDGDIVKTPRIGIDYAGPYWSKIKWRFYLKGNRYPRAKRVVLSFALCALRPVPDGAGLRAIIHIASIPFKSGFSLS